MGDRKKIELCSLKRIPDPGSLGITLQHTKEKLDIFLIRKDGQVFGYLNRCPHTGVNLDWQPHQFLDITEGFIQCATHGALFRIEDGYCLRGPCAGQSLESIDVVLEGDAVMLAGVGRE